MDSIDNNKKIIFVCITLIIIFLIVYLIFKPGEEKFLFQSNDSYLKDYKINEVVPIYVSEKDIASKYLSEYVNMLLYNKEMAYELLSDKEKAERFKNYDDFLNFIDGLYDLKFEEANVIKYSYRNYDNKKTMYVVDNSNNTFKFIENSLMDYRVEIN